MNIKYRVLLNAEDGEYVLEDNFIHDYQAATYANRYRFQHGLDDGQELYIEEYEDGYYH